MNTLLIFFALPIATIIISIALQKILRNPLLVSAVIFAIFLVITFIVGDLIFLVATIVYAIIAFITALLTQITCRILRELSSRSNENGNSCNCRNISNNTSQNNGNLLTIRSSGCNGVENQLLTINTSCPGNDEENNDSNNNCNCNSSSNSTIALNANIVPNNNNRSGNFYGCYRRR